MVLINGMTGDTNGGVCLKKHYSYFVYVKNGIGGSCSDSYHIVEEDLANGTYILPYINQNSNYSMDIYDTENCLNLGSGVSIRDWTDNYINALVSSGYTGYDDSTIEDRVIYDQITNSYYIIQQSDDLQICPLDKAEKWAIYDTKTLDIWNGIGNYYYSEVDDCDILTGRLIVALKNINDNSETRYILKYVEKCIPVAPTV